jgi:hypothetical protein
LEGRFLIKVGLAKGPLLARMRVHRRNPVCPLNVDSCRFRAPLRRAGIRPFEASKAVVGNSLGGDEVTTAGDRQPCACPEGTVPNSQSAVVAIEAIQARDARAKARGVMLASGRRLRRDSDRLPGAASEAKTHGARPIGMTLSGPGGAQEYGCATSWRMAGRASACRSAARGVVAGCNRAAAALDVATARPCLLLASVQYKLSKMKTNRGELRQGRYQWRSRAERTQTD